MITLIIGQLTVEYTDKLIKSGLVAINFAARLLSPPSVNFDVNSIANYLIISSN